MRLSGFSFSVKSDWSRHPNRNNLKLLVLHNFEFCTGLLPFYFSTPTVQYSQVFFVIYREQWEVPSTDKVLRWGRLSVQRNAPSACVGRNAWFPPVLGFERWGSGGTNAVKDNLACLVSCFLLWIRLRFFCMQSIVLCLIQWKWAVLPFNVICFHLCSPVQRFILVCE